MAAAKTLAIRIETVDALVAKFRERWDFEAEDEKMIEDFKASLAEMKGTKKARKSKESSKEPKKKREPSPYNMFVSEKKAEIIAKGFTGQEMIREAARMWNALNANKTEEAEPETADEEASDADEE